MNTQTITKKPQHFFNRRKPLPFLCLLLTLLTLTEATAQRLTERRVRKLFRESAIMQSHYTGFALYDQDKQQMVYGQNADIHSVPASNTKLLTLYTAMHMLGDSIPGLRYITSGDSLIFWGTGDPSLLHPDLKATRVFELLKNTPHKLYYSPINYAAQEFEPSNWRADVTALPLEENVALIYADASGQLQIHPRSLLPNLKPDSTFHPRQFTVRRNPDDNTFQYPLMPVPADFRRAVNLKTSTELTLALLQDTLQKPIEVINRPLPDHALTLYSIPADTLYKRMMLPSDNFLAEQILLVCSSTLPGPLSVEAAIAYSNEHILTGLPHPPKWVDGSGLSRYNLFTPSTLIALLNRIYAEIGDEQRLRDLFPVGGVSGTLRTAYQTDNGVPFVWAKTGSLTGVHNQSGYLVTRKGRRLVYSFMNNNFVRPTAEVRTEMSRIMTEIHNRF